MKSILEQYAIEAEDLAEFMADSEIEMINNLTANQPLFPAVFRDMANHQHQASVPHDVYTLDSLPLQSISPNLCASNKDFGSKADNRLSCNVNNRDQCKTVEADSLKLSETNKESSENGTAKVFGSLFSQPREEPQSVDASQVTGHEHSSDDVRERDKGLPVFMKPFGYMGVREKHSTTGLDTEGDTIMIVKTEQEPGSISASETRTADSVVGPEPSTSTVDDGPNAKEKQDTGLSTEEIFLGKAQDLSFIPLRMGDKVVSGSTAGVKPVASVTPQVHTVQPVLQNGGKKGIPKPSEEILFGSNKKEEGSGKTAEDRLAKTEKAHTNVSSCLDGLPRSETKKTNSSEQPMGESSATQANDLKSIIAELISNVKKLHSANPGPESHLVSFLSELAGPNKSDKDLVNAQGEKKNDSGIKITPTSQERAHYRSDGEISESDQESETVSTGNASAPESKLRFETFECNQCPVSGVADAKTPENVSSVRGKSVLYDAVDSPEDALEPIDSSEDYINSLSSEEETAPGRRGTSSSPVEKNNNAVKHSDNNRSQSVDCGALHDASNWHTTTATGYLSEVRRSSPGAQQARDDGPRTCSLDGKDLLGWADLPRDNKGNSSHMKAALEPKGSVPVSERLALEQKKWDENPQSTAVLPGPMHQDPSQVDLREQAYSHHQRLSLGTRKSKSGSRNHTSSDRVSAEQRSQQGQNRASQSPRRSPHRRSTHRRSSCSPRRSSTHHRKAFHNQQRSSGSPRRLSPNHRKFYPNQQRPSGSPRRLSPNHRKFDPNQQRPSGSPRRLSPNHRKFDPNQQRPSGSLREFSQSHRKFDANQQKSSGNPRRLSPNHRKFDPNHQRSSGSPRRTLANHRKFLPSQQRSSQSPQSSTSCRQSSSSYRRPLPSPRRSSPNCRRPSPSQQRACQSSKRSSQSPRTLSPQSQRTRPAHRRLSPGRGSSRGWRSDFQYREHSSVKVHRQSPHRRGKPRHSSSLIRHGDAIDRHFGCSDTDPSHTRGQSSDPSVADTRGPANGCGTSDHKIMAAEPGYKQRRSRSREGSLRCNRTARRYSPSLDRQPLTLHGRRFDRRSVDHDSDWGSVESFRQEQRKVNYEGKTESCHIPSGNDRGSQRHFESMNERPDFGSRYDRGASWHHRRGSWDRKGGPLDQRDGSWDYRRDSLLKEDSDEGCVNNFTAHDMTADGPDNHRDRSGEVSILSRLGPSPTPSEHGDEHDGHLDQLRFSERELDEHNLRRSSLFKHSFMPHSGHGDDNMEGHEAFGHYDHSDGRHDSNSCENPRKFANYREWERMYGSVSKTDGNKSDTFGMEPEVDLRYTSLSDEEDFTGRSCSPEDHYRQHRREVDEDQPNVSGICLGQPGSDMSFNELNRHHDSVHNRRPDHKQQRNERRYDPYASSQRNHFSSHHDKDSRWRYSGQRNHDERVGDSELSFDPGFQEKDNYRDSRNRRRRIEEKRRSSDGKEVLSEHIDHFLCTARQHSRQRPSPELESRDTMEFLDCSVQAQLDALGQRSVDFDHFDKVSESSQFDDQSVASQKRRACNEELSPVGCGKKQRLSPFEYKSRPQEHSGDKERGSDRCFTVQGRNQDRKLFDRDSRRTGSQNRNGGGPGRVTDSRTHSLQMAHCGHSYQDERSHEAFRKNCLGEEQSRPRSPQQIHSDGREKQNRTMRSVFRIKQNLGNTQENRGDVYDGSGEWLPPYQDLDKPSSEDNAPSQDMEHCYGEESWIGDEVDLYDCNQGADKQNYSAGNMIQGKTSQSFRPDLRQFLKKRRRIRKLSQFKSECFTKEENEQMERGRYMDGNE